MTLAAGDLTTFARAETWIEGTTANSQPILQQLISSMSTMIKSELNRAELYSHNFTRTFDGQGTNQIVLPDYPVTGVTTVQVGAAVIPAAPLPSLPGVSPVVTFGGYGYRIVTTNLALPGQPSVLEFVNGVWWPGVQNVQVTYTAGYLVSKEAWTVPGTPYQVTVMQPSGIWCRDNGVVYAATGVALVPVLGPALPTVGQYIAPLDAAPGLYTFSAADANANLLISYSFVPADLEEACIQMVAERWSYRNRVGVISKSLGGQETMRYLRGGRGSLLPPEVEALIMPYVSVVPPAIGAPV